MINQLLGDVYFDPSIFSKIETIENNRCFNEVSVSSLSLDMIRWVLSKKITLPFRFVGFNENVLINSKEQFFKLVEENVLEIEKIILKDIYLFGSPVKSTLQSSTDELIKDLLPDPESYLADRNIARLVLILADCRREHSIKNGLIKPRTIKDFFIKIKSIIENYKRTSLIKSGRVKPKTVSEFLLVIKNRQKRK